MRTDMKINEAKRKKVCFITTTRAEYGLLKPVMSKVYAESCLEFQLIVSGTHLLHDYGDTIKEIEEDGFPISKRAEILMAGDSSLAIAKSMGLAILSFSEMLSELKPDLLVVLGDRYEIFAAVSAAYTLRIPVGHIAGGEVTEGALDEAFRHSITKMSQIHFTANERYRKRVIQLGEQPENVFMVGDTGSENIRNLKLWNKQEIYEFLGLKENQNYFLVTYHPTTLSKQSVEEEIHQLFEACEAFPEDVFVFTKANADENGRKINEKLDAYAQSQPDRIKVFASLGQLRYFSAVKYCKAVLGNSSSGILEVPSLGKATVNIGDRQQGRLRADSVIDCQPKKQEIVAAIKKAISEEFQENFGKSSFYNQKQNTSEEIVKHIKQFLQTNEIQPKKIFYDLERNE